MALDLDALAAVVTIERVAVVAQLDLDARAWWSRSWWRSIAMVVAELAAELVAAPLDIDVLAELVSSRWWVAVVAELEPQHAGHRRAQLAPASWWWRCSAGVRSRWSAGRRLRALKPSDKGPKRSTAAPVSVMASFQGSAPRAEPAPRFISHGRPPDPQAIARCRRPIPGCKLDTWTSSQRSLISTMCSPPQAKNQRVGRKPIRYCMRA